MFPLASEFVLYPYARWQAGLIMIILAAISLTLPLSTIVTTSPLALLRPSSGISKTKTLWIQWLVSAIWVFLIYIITLGDWIGGVVFVVWWTLVLLGIAWIIWAILKWSVKTISLRRQSNFMQFDGLRSMIAPWNQSILMTIGILITMTALIVISALSSSFLNQLASISEDQPSLYVLNILPEYIPTITQDYPDAELYDSILSRIQWVNGLTLSDHLEQNQWSEWWSRGDSFTREFNVTTATLSPASYLAWSPPAIGEVSLEEWFAQRLGVQLGDTIQFFIQWRTFDLELTSLRAIQRDGSWPFFYVQFPVKEFQDAPKSFFWLVDVARDEKPAFKTSLVEKLWPALSFVDTDDIIETVTDITSKLITVIRILVGCLAVFVAVSIAVCLDAMKSLKTQKVKLYRLLGATSSMIKTSLRSEQVTLFIISLSISALLAWSIVITIFSLTEFLEWSWGIVGEIILLLVVVFLWILWLIKWMYREVV
jgi:putative ABC transport system permease protein